MKKIVLLLVSAILVFALVGCSSGGSQPSAEASETPTEIEAQPSETASPEESAAPEKSAEQTTEAQSTSPVPKEDMSNLVLVTVDVQRTDSQSESFGLANSQPAITYTYSDSGPITEANDDVNTYFYKWDDAIWQAVTDSLIANDVLNWNETYGTQSDDYETFWMVSLVFSDDGESFTSVNKSGSDEFPDGWEDFLQDIKTAYKNAEEE